MARFAATLLAIAIVAAACSGGGDSESIANTVAVTGSDTVGVTVADADVPIEPESDGDADAEVDAEVDAEDEPESDATPGSDDGPGIRPTGVVTLASPGVLSYDASPDGAWLTVENDEGSICLVPADQASDGIPFDSDVPGTVCGSPDGSGVVRWSPDSSRVVISDEVLRFGRSVPLKVLDTDGTETELVPALADEFEVIGAAFGPAFLDPETVIFARLLTDPFRPEYSTIAVDGSDEQVVAEVTGRADGAALTPNRLPVADEVSMIVAMGELTGSSDIWSIDRAGDATQLTTVAFGAEVASDVEPDDRSASDLAPIDISSRHVLVVRPNAWSDFIVNAERIEMFALVDRAAGTIVPIGNRAPNEPHYLATLSPDGEFVATVTRGIEDGPREPSVLIASVDAVLAGEPVWAELPLGDRQAGTIDLGLDATSLHWGLDEMLLLETTDELLQIELEIDG